MATYYHGTIGDSISKILGKGICPRQSCPLIAKKGTAHQYPTCDPSAVYLTRDFSVAADFASGAGATESEHGIVDTRAIVFKVTKLPKKCVVMEDPEGVGVTTYGSWDSWIVKDCGCVKPTAYCEVNFENPEKCKWVKV